MKTAIFCVLVLLSAPVHAWSEADAKREVGYLILHTIDWGQTLDISESCDSGRYHETNPILGECPSRSDVNRYFLVTGIAHYAVARSLAPKHRRWFQYVTIGMEINAVVRNFSIGLRVRF